MLDISACLRPFLDLVVYLRADTSALVTAINGGAVVTRVTWAYVVEEAIYDAFSTGVVILARDVLVNDFIPIIDDRVVLFTVRFMYASGYDV